MMSWLVAVAPPGAGRHRPGRRTGDCGRPTDSRYPTRRLSQFAPPIVEIQTEAPGLSTPEVEALVSVPLETAVAGVPGVKISLI